MRVSIELFNVEDTDSRDFHIKKRYDKSFDMFRALCDVLLLSKETGSVSKEDLKNILEYRNVKLSELGEINE